VCLLACLVGSKDARAGEDEKDRKGGHRFVLMVTAALLGGFDNHFEFRPHLRKQNLPLTRILVQYLTRAQLMLTWANEWDGRFDDLHNDPLLKHLYCKNL
jgi:hypothetical protein